MKNRFLSIGSALLLCGVTHLFAGDVDSDKNPITTTTQELPAFRHDGHEVELISGSLLSIQSKTTSHPQLNYAIEAMRYGWMFNDVYGPSFWRGNDELLVEAFGGEVTKGPGNALGGGMLILRHNFVHEGCKLVPYIQIGAGALDNDIYHEQTQRLIGEGFEFMLHAGAGVRWMINDHWALALEGEYRHISNADLASRNYGLNSLGGTLGLNWLF